MDRRQPRAAPASPGDDRFLRFLKPGALARIRDTRIVARSARSVPLSRLSRSPSPGQQVSPHATAAHRLRFASLRLSGPRHLSRKKLAAAKGVYLAPPSPDSADPFVDVRFGSDPVAAR